MTQDRFVYVVYIQSTPEKVWNALTDGEMTRQYWAHENVSDWQPGSKWQSLRLDEARTPRIVGEVMESVPPRRLVVSWAPPADAADRARHSRVAFDLEPVGDMVRLTVTHDELEAGSEMLRSISNGWPRVLSSLKSLLETGRPLNTWA
ncbi:MAG: SRPBCC family protein [Thermoanaerobaculia bacterium]